MKTLITTLTGYSNSITKDLDPSTRIRLFLAAVSVFVAASISALLFATTFSRLCLDGEHFWSLFSGWFCFVWLLDTVVLQSSSKASTVVFMRVGICMLLGFFNSITLDTFVFKKDLENHLKEAYETKVAAADSTFRRDQLGPVEQYVAESTAQLERRNAALYDKISGSHDQLFQEYNGEAPSGKVGRGKIFLGKEALHNAATAIPRAEIARNDSAISDLKKQVAELKGQLVTRINGIVVPESAGLRDNVNAMHDLIWGPKGTVMDQVYFMLLFLLGFVAEALVLIVKIALRESMDTYRDISQKISEMAKTSIIDQAEQSNQVRTLQGTLQQQRVLNNLSSAIAKEQYRHKAATSVDEIEATVRQGVLEDQAIEEALEDAKGRNEGKKKSMGNRYEEFGPGLFNRSLSTIRKAMARLTGAKAKPDNSYSKAA